MYTKKMLSSHKDASFIIDRKVDATGDHHIRSVSEKVTLKQPRN